MTGYEVETVGNVSTDLYCFVCLKIMRNAVQPPCGHVMCQGCFDALEKDASERNTELACRKCYVAITRNKVTSVPLIDRMILSIQVRCIHHVKGCQWTGELGKLEMHLTKCSHLANLCSYGCGEKILPCMEMQHSTECEYRTISCEYEVCGCDKKVIFKDYSSHLEQSRDYHVMISLQKMVVSENERKLQGYMQVKGEVQSAQLKLDAILKEVEEEENEIKEEIETSLQVITRDIEAEIYSLKLHVDKSVNEFDRNALKHAVITDNDMEKLKLDCDMGGLQRKLDTVFMDHRKQYSCKAKAYARDKLKSMEAVRNNVSILALKASGYVDDTQLCKMIDVFEKSLEDGTRKVKNVLGKIVASSANRVEQLKNAFKLEEESLSESISLKCAYQTRFKNMVDNFHNTPTLYLWKVDAFENSVIGSINCLASHVISGGNLSAQPSFCQYSVVWYNRANITVYHRPISIPPSSLIKFSVLSQLNSKTYECDNFSPRLLGQPNYNQNVVSYTVVSNQPISPRRLVNENVSFQKLQENEIQKMLKKTVQSISFNSTIQDKNKGVLVDDVVYVRCELTN
ncbi:uncharacterized protein LOC130635568 [Hydractinia symbiolongicarpus]|uniref:uncharacterized protein LOC130635531 n=1 Tax=Hydractinia symbiolongicarpus TaxID=13093 RepID=UPI00254F0AB8|nr:uncharacterized protein LOC130635531 [Hydractinia symbiolongicarpus]XP_057300869.1 uncharacterized protein LOC130635531 [Hydractinia symbiolongicarpus]XP_057300870.1 uncharacterized protein LOC130635531 [Hydractinia symbiolongicarpus]XP_057300908.1 uncharacterized protein LOC130635568 [Hydractinia symbiolongicarpus]XP_057300909.1 uncharacterized protein LOC130635568 [Hydractinia symbiolongicarpus]XP_057300910.1 uncharacterized protein LOC130635568 [Hydractinia symbiolongicarpus]